MSRIALTDGSGTWFSTESAEYYKEGTFHDGQNWISKATGDQWTHEGLYRTQGGRFILHKWSQWQGSHESYDQIYASEAAVWFSINGYDPHRDCEKEFADLELT